MPAIESIAGVHIVEFYRSRDVFSRYCIYNFEGFTCVLLVSIDSGKTHQKSPAHSSVFRGFFAKCVWQILKPGCSTKYIYTYRTTVSVPSSELGLPTPSEPPRNQIDKQQQTRKPWKGCPPPPLLSKIRKKYTK